MSDDATTKPTIETILERINALGAEFTARFNRVEAEFTARFDGLENEVKGLRADMEKGFRQIQRQFDQIAGELTRLRAAIDDLEDRFDKLEKQPA